MRLRTWMPLVAVFVVLLSVVSIFVYAIPATRARVSDYARERVLAEATLWRVRPAHLPSAPAESASKAG